MAYSRFFIIAGILSAAIGLLHVVIIFAGSQAYIFFGAGKEMADADKSGSLVPDLLTLAVALVFLVFTAYAFSAGGWIRRLPALRIVIIAIAFVYVLRGLGIMGDIHNYFHLADYPFRYLLFSLVSLVTGLFYTAGIVKGYSQLSTKNPELPQG